MIWQAWCRISVCKIVNRERTKKRWFDEPALFCVVSENDSLVGMFQEGENNVSRLRRIVKYFVDTLSIDIVYYQLIERMRGSGGN